jgi:hypothetical protein
LSSPTISVADAACDPDGSEPVPPASTAADAEDTEGNGSNEEQADPEPDPDPEDTDGKIKVQGNGAMYAHEAVDRLRQIKKNDPLRERGFQIVLDWIKHNGGDVPDPLAVALSLSKKCVQQFGYTTVMMDDLSRVEQILCDRLGLDRNLPMSERKVKSQKRRGLTPRERYLADILHLVQAIIEGLNEHLKKKKPTAPCILLPSDVEDITERLSVLTPGQPW